MTAFNPGDTIINSFMVSGDGGSVDLARHVQGFSVFESLTKPYTSFVATVLDTADIINKNVNLNGQNTLQLSFNQPGMQPYQNQFILMAIEKAVKLQNQRTQVYKMTGYSPHMANPTVVAKSYQNQPLTQIASDLVKNFLKPHKPLKIGAASMGLAGNEKFPHLIENLPIFKAIRHTLQKASSTKDQTSAYMFFENNKNIIIDTLENMMNTAGSVATYVQRPMGEKFILDAVRQQFTIMDLQEEARVDVSQQAQSTNQQVNTYDFFANKFQSVIKNFGAALGAGGGRARSKMHLPYNIQAPPTFLKNFMPQKRKMAGVYDSQAITIQVMLNTALTVSAGVTISTLAPAGDTDRVDPDKINGKFMISEVRHVYHGSDAKPQGTSIVRAVKGQLTPDQL